MGKRSRVDRRVLRDCQHHWHEHEGLGGRHVWCCHCGAGVEVVYDSVGRTTFLAGLDVLAPRGMMVLFGQSSGPVEPFDPQLLNRKGSLYLTRPSLGHFMAAREELVARTDDLFGWIADGTVRLRVAHEFALADAAAAHDALEGRRTAGKVLLVP